MPKTYEVVITWPCGNAGKAVISLLGPTLRAECTTSDGKTLARVTPLSTGECKSLLGDLASASDVRCQTARRRLRGFVLSQFNDLIEDRLGKWVPATPFGGVSAWER